MNALQLWHLQKFCDQHGLDYQLIDNTLTYSENKDQLNLLVPKDLDALLEAGESQLEQHMTDHFLTFYVNRTSEGATISEKTGEPVESL